MSSGHFFLPPTGIDQRPRTTARTRGCDAGTVRRKSDPVLRLRRAGIIYREHALDAPGIYALVWMGQASDSAQHCLDAITQIIRYGQAASVFRGDDPHLIASSIWVSIHGFIQFELRSAQPRTRGRERVDRSYGYLLDLLIRGIQR